jgi:hypothetical protein
MAIDLDACLEIAVDAARRAAAELESWRSRFTVREKGRADLVTEADLAAQKIVRQTLLDRFPDHAFLGEEDGANPRKPDLDAPPTWIVDPLDGTTNYVHDFPMYCVSIGLLAAEELVVGVVSAAGRTLRGGERAGRDSERPTDPHEPDRRSGRCTPRHRLSGRFGSARTAARLVAVFRPANAIAPANGIDRHQFRLRRLRPIRCLVGLRQ